MSWTLHAVVEVADPEWESACSWYLTPGGWKVAQALDACPDVVGGWPAEDTYGQLQAELGEGLYDRKWCPAHVFADVFDAVESPTRVVRAFATTVATLSTLFGGEKVRVIFYRT